jgi:hypothetical protein
MCRTGCNTTLGRSQNIDALFQSLTRGLRAKQMPVTLAELRRTEDDHCEPMQRRVRIHDTAPLVARKAKAPTIIPATNNGTPKPL